MIRYMLDTNAVSQLVKGHPVVTARVVAAPMTALCISAITAGELLFGLAKRPQAVRLHQVMRELLLRLDVLPWEDSVAQRYGLMRAALELAGRPLAPLDGLIAAHALEIGAVLVSNDAAFKQVTGLQIEDWTVLSS